MLPIQFSIQKTPKGVSIYLIDENSQIHLSQLPDAIKDACLLTLESGINLFSHFTKEHKILVVKSTPTSTCNNSYTEGFRKAGASISSIIKDRSIKEVGITNLTSNDDTAYSFIEGLTLRIYQFLKYKSDAKQIAHKLKAINFQKGSISSKKLKELQAVLGGVYIARDLINEPHSYLNAVQLAKDLKAIAKEGMIKCSVYSKAKIEQLGMTGLLAVNKGSITEPSFTILEHKPGNAKNQQPIVLVGKGVVYDTGGLSLKPTANSMDKMKSDMGGAALVAGVMYIIGTLELPLHVIGLIPATDNRPGLEAYAPGDVIKMYSGKTVEVLNTDAEGRMILADALHFAKKYKPSLVMDFATLTGAASRAFGDIAMVAMGNENKTLENIKKSGFEVNEKVVEVPLWEEYGALIKSDIADIKNIGGASGGMITAGKFLEHFIDYPWIHFDIAGVTYRNNEKDYLTIGGTGFGIRAITKTLLKEAL